MIAIAEQIRNTSPRPLPSTLLTMYGRPSVPMFESERFFVAIIAKSISRPPMRNAAEMARRMAFGACRRGSSVSSASEPAVSKP